MPDKIIHDEMPIRKYDTDVRAALDQSDIIAADFYWVVRLPRGTALDRDEPLCLESGEWLHVGDKIHAMCGDMTGAGRPEFHLKDGYVQFAGVYEPYNRTGPLVLFKAKTSAGELHPLHTSDVSSESGVYDVYIGWCWYDGALMYSTPQIAGRIINTKYVAWWEGENLPEDWDKEFKHDAK